mgnify:CR=1 FL=1
MKNLTMNFVSLIQNKKIEYKNFINNPTSVRKF